MTNLDPTYGFALKEKIATLASSLEAKAPGIATLLQSIDKELRADPDLVTSLQETDIATIVCGLERQTQVEIVTSTPKGGTAKEKKKLGGMSASELGLDDL